MVPVFVSACGVAPLSDRERLTGDGHQTQAQIDAYAIMVAATRTLMPSPFCVS
jgi:hypothetical protein